MQNFNKFVIIKITRMILRPVKEIIILQAGFLGLSYVKNPHSKICMVELGPKSAF